MPKSIRGKKTGRKKITKKAPRKVEEKEEGLNGEYIPQKRRGGRPPVTADLPEELIFNQHQMADLLVISTPKLRDLLAQGVVVRESHGRYPAFQNTKIYINHLATKKRDAGPTRSKEIESARLTKVKADREELLYLELDGTLIRVGDVEIAWSKLLIALKQALLTLPSQIDYLLREAEETERATIVEDAIRKALEVLSDEPEYLAKRDKRLERFEDPEAFGESLSTES